MNESQGIHVRRPSTLIQGTFSAQSIREWEMEGEFGIDCMYNFNERSLKKAYKPGAESHSREGFKFLFS